MSVTLSRLDSRGGFKMMGGGCCAFRQVSTVPPKRQIPLELQQTLLIVESHVVGGAGLPPQIQVQRSANLLHTASLLGKLSWGCQSNTHTACLGEAGGEGGQLVDFSVQLLDKVPPHS